MTKKSQARIQRDLSTQQAAAYKAKNTGWDDIKEVYQSNQARLNTMISPASRFFAIVNINLFISPGMHDYTRKTILGFANDIREFQSRLNGIYNKHKDRSGMVDTEEAGEYTKLLSYYTAYNEFGNAVDLLLAPLFQQVCAIMETIEENIRNAKAALPPVETAEEQPNA